MWNKKDVIKNLEVKVDPIDRLLEQLFNCLETCSEEYTATISQEIRETIKIKQKG
jgi:hypothetical protein